MSTGIQQVLTKELSAEYLITSIDVLVLLRMVYSIFACAVPVVDYVGTADWLLQLNNLLKDNQLWTLKDFLC